MGRRSWKLLKWSSIGDEFVIGEDTKPNEFVKVREVFAGDVVLSEVDVIRILEKLKRIGCDVVGPCDSCDIKQIIDRAMKET